MAIRVALYHETRYRYDRFIALGPQTIRLRPAPHARTPVTLFAVDRAGGHFLNWQQDRVQQLPGAPRVSGARCGISGRGRSRRRNDGDQSVRFLRRSRTAEKYPFIYEPRIAPRPDPLSRNASRRPEACELVRRRSHQPLRRSIFWWTSTSDCSREIKYLIRMEPGVQIAGRNAAIRARFVPRHGLAAGADLAALGAGGAVCLGLFDSTRRT